MHHPLCSLETCHLEFITYKQRIFNIGVKVTFMNKRDRIHACLKATTVVSALIIVLAVSACRTGSRMDSVTVAPAFLSVAQVLDIEGIRRAGFDVDDTLLFSSAAFAQGFASGHEYGSDEFWAIVNNSDREHSTVKQATREIVSSYREHGIELYAITARRAVGGAGLARHLSQVLGIPEANVFFEPDSKTERIRELGLDVYFGDSDTDITDATAAGVRAIRVQRSRKSSYRNEDGTLRKYHPGDYGESVILKSEN
jgi:acid phosphatase (class B)